MSSPPTKQITPTAPDLNAAIKDVLDKNPNSDGAGVHKALVQGHPNWKLPERRVAKFVKRQKSGKPIGADDESVTPSIKSGSSLRSWMKKRASRKKVNKSSSGSKPDKQLEAPVVSSKTEQQEETTASSVPAQIPESTPEATDETNNAEVKSKTEEKTIEKKYRELDVDSDENALCEGCLIL